MDLLQRLDAQVLSRTLSWLPQRQALQLMILASDWVKLVAAHLRRLATWTMGEVGADFFWSKADMEPQKLEKFNHNKNGLFGNTTATFFCWYAQLDAGSLLQQLLEYLFTLFFSFIFTAIGSTGVPLNPLVNYRFFLSKLPLLWGIPHCQTYPYYCLSSCWLIYPILQYISTIIHIRIISLSLYIYIYHLVGWYSQYIYIYILLYIYIYTLLYTYIYTLLYIYYIYIYIISYTHQVRSIFGWSCA